MTSQCHCGCTLTENTGHIIAPAQQPCRSNIRRWTIHVKPQYTITFTIDYFRLNHLSSVRVYDSATSTNAAAALPLLLKLTKDEEDDDTATMLVTSGNRMLIEYVTVNNGVAAVRNNEGFIASYIATDTGIARLHYHSSFIT